MASRRAAAGGRGGFTLVEALIVVAIVSIMAAIAVPNFLRYTEAVRVEEETKRVYALTMAARGRSVASQRVTFVELSAARVRTFEDTNPAPDGNRTLEAASDRLLGTVTVTHAVDTGGLGGAGAISFGTDGVTVADGFLRLVSTVNAEYDCIRVEPTRIRTGKYDATANICRAK